MVAQGFSRERWLCDPVVADHSVFTGPQNTYSAGVVTAYAVTTGTQRWSSPTCDDSGPIALAYSNGVVVDVDIGSEATAMDSLTGEFPWQPLCVDGGEPGYTLATHGQAFFWEDGIATGEFFPNWDGGWENMAFEGGRTPAISHGSVYSAFGSTLGAASEQTGATLWSASIDGACACLSAPTVSPDGTTVYAGGGALYARNALTGAEAWTQTQISNASAAAEANGVLYVNSGSATAPGLYAVDASTGAILWNDADLGRTRDTPTVANGVVYDVSRSGVLDMVNSATGTIIASRSDPHGVPFAHSIRSQVVVVNGYVFVTTASTTATNHLDAYKPA